MKKKSLFAILLPAAAVQSIVLVLFFTLVVVVITARAAVTLVSFTGTPGNQMVKIDWETATEFDNAGFFISRSGQSDGTYTRISEFIPSIGGGLTGALYSYEDEGLVNGATYYYKLEALGNNQAVEYYGPITVTLQPGGATATPTPTRTATLTATPTQTIPPGVTPTSTATFTPTPTATHTPPGAASPTATRTPTPSPTVTNPPPTFTATAHVPKTATAILPTQTTYRLPVIPPTQPPPAASQVPQQPTFISPTTPTQVIIPTNTATATLLPVPEVTIAFGIDTNTPVVVAQAVDAQSTGAALSGGAQVAPANPAAGGEKNNLNTLRLVLMGIVGLIWVLIAVWFYIYLRQVDRSE